MKLLILSHARDDLHDIRKHLSDYGTNPPRKFRESFEKFCVQVTDMPYMFGQCEYNLDYRTAVIEFGYLIFYKVDVPTNSIMVYRVLHGKRNIEPLI